MQYIMRILTDGFGYVVQLLLRAADQDNVEPSAGKLQIHTNKSNIMTKVLLDWSQKHKIIHKKDN